MPMTSFRMPCVRNVAPGLAPAALLDQPVPYGLP